MANVLDKQNVQHVQEAEHRFVDDIGQLYARFGLSVTFGRVYGFLLLHDGPLSLDELAEQLHVSKSAVSAATRDLERAGVARRTSALGSRRVLYEASDDMVPTFQAQFTRVRLSLPVFERARDLVPRGPAKERLAELVELHEFWLAEGDAIIERWRKRTRRAAR